MKKVWELPHGLRNVTCRQFGPSQFAIYRDTALPASALDGGFANASATMEPSTGISGKNEFQTGNWYATYSYNANAASPSWKFLNPYTIFGSGFCCDQVTLYDAEWDRQFWLLQMSGTLLLANAASTNLASWCYYNIEPGLPTSRCKARPT